MENDLDPLDGSGDRRRVANVAGDGLDARRVAAGHALDGTLEKRPVPSDEVVEDPHGLAARGERRRPGWTR